jgi:anti-sigma regulatory factor (Ser/Thr protein kinase)
VSSEGRVTRCETVNSPPLGWFSDLPVHCHQQACPAGGLLFLWTDGLEDLAESLNVSPLSLATALQRAQSLGRTMPQIAQARDDVLVVSVQLAPDSILAPHWLPVLQENYSGTPTPPVDRWQVQWENCLQLALPDLPESRRFDVMLALRESIINALIHGCAGRPELHGRLSIAVNPAERILRAIVSDPGPGHDFAVKPPDPADEPADLHRGLSLIRRLATQMTPSRHGAELLLDFRY